MSTGTIVRPDALRVFVQQTAKPLAPDALDAVLEHVGDAALVLLGEATHGTHEFYRYRAELSKRLICERNFDAILAEADWPDALCIDRYVRLRDSGSAGSSAERALSSFDRFPRWMWRNKETVQLLEWMRQRNATLPASRRTGFYGLDLYSLRRSMQSVLDYLGRTDPEAAQRARARYACFDHFGEDPQSYGYAASFGISKTCEDEVVAQLRDLLARDDPTQDGGDEEAFFAAQNARVARNAEAYYRAMFGGRHTSWNLRDTHMADTLCALHEHLSSTRKSAARLIVWAHNSHIGDARRTEMGDQGQLNLGQLVRERFGSSSYLLGFTTYAGAVCAASRWDGEMERKAIRPALPDSYEYLLHDARGGNFFLPLRDAAIPTQRHLERAIGVIYLPHSERVSHYFEADLRQQFDGVVHLDVTSPLSPLDAPTDAGDRRAADTFPTGI